MNTRCRASPALIYGGLFCLLTLLVNLVHYAFLADQRFLFSALYYGFNIGLFWFTAVLFRRAPETMNRLTLYTVCLSLFLQGALVCFIGTQEAGRAIGSFNNPNQLAYWTLLAFAMLLVLKRAAPFNVRDIGIIGICLYLQAMALSKAGLIVTALMVLYTLCLPNLRAGGRLAVIALLLGMCIFFLFDSERFYQAGELPGVSSITQRLETIGFERDDSAQGRGYGRLLDYPAYMIFGAGEGGFNRFGGTGQELHSSFATMLFSYGLCGLLLFVLFLAGVYAGLPRRYLVLLGIILLFGLVHQAFRFSAFWMFLSVCYAARYLDGAHDQRRVGAAETERIG